MTFTQNTRLAPSSAGVHVARVAIRGTTDAIVVRPADHNQRRHAMAGVLWLHWLGHNRGNMWQFLPEAVDLAHDGVVSLLPQGTFPWRRNPSGGSGDAEMVRRELRNAHRALSALRNMDGVDASATAIVAHDYGAMYAMLLRDPLAKLLVAAAPDAEWADWFIEHWPTNVADQRSYARSFASLSPLRAAGSYGSRLFLQWADKDEYVSADVPGRYAEAAPTARVTTYDYDHQLGDAAVADRLGALRECLVGNVETSGAAGV